MISLLFVLIIALGIAMVTYTKGFLDPKETDPEKVRRSVLKFRSCGIALVAIGVAGMAIQVLW